MIRRFLVVLAMMLVVLNGMFLLDAASATERFPDVQGHWAEDAIEYLNNQEIVNGLPNGQFGVDHNISRADAAIMIARAKGLDLRTQPNMSPFKDIKPGSYYYKEVLAASKAGFLNGYPDQTFNPSGKLTREEMAKVLVEAYNLKNNGGAVFRDVKIKAWSFSAIQTLVSNNIANGFPDRTFQPQKSISRAEFAMLLARTMDESFRDPSFEIDQSFPTVEAEAKYVIENYSSTSDYILRSVSLKEGKSIETLISQWSYDQNLFQTIETAVHEETHAFTHVMKDSEYHFSTGRWLFHDSYVLNNKNHVVSYYENDVFKSETMGSNIPVDLRTFRWDTYVGAKSGNVGANVHGPYGLLNEFHAYFYGNKAAYDSYEYLLTLPYRKQQWTNYYTALDGSAFYEFKFFTLSYLLHAKEHNIEVYNRIMNNEQYKKGFKAIYNNYQNYVEVLKPAREKKMVNDLQKMGIHARIADGLLWIGGSGHGNGNNISGIKEEMTQSKYTNILNELLK